jgi:C1A family cysteine protease
MMETLGKMALALAMVMPIALASLMVVPRGTAIGLVMALAFALSSASALASVLAMALVTPITWAMVRGARLSVLQSAASQRSCWIFPSLQELESGLIPAPTSRRPSLR